MKSQTQFLTAIVLFLLCSFFLSHTLLFAGDVNDVGEDRYIYETDRDGEMTQDDPMDTEVEIGNYYEELEEQEENDYIYHEEEMNEPEIEDADYDENAEIDFPAEKE